MQQTEKQVPLPTGSETFTLKILLTIASLASFLFIQHFFGKVVFERVSRYKQEYKSHPVPYDSLMASRFGLDYLLPKYMEQFMKPQTPILLLPPADYVKRYITYTSAFTLKNPIYMFYMNSKIRCVTAQSNDYQKANCTILIDQHGQCYPVKISSKQELDEIVALFKSGAAFVPSKQ